MRANAFTWSKHEPRERFRFSRYEKDIDAVVTWLTLQDETFPLNDDIKPIGEIRQLELSGTIAHKCNHAEKQSSSFAKKTYNTILIKYDEYENQENKKNNGIQTRKKNKMNKKSKKKRKKNKKTNEEQHQKDAEKHQEQ